jgi:hypothetical protein
MRPPFRKEAVCILNEAFIQNQKDVISPKQAQLFDLIVHDLPKCLPRNWMNLADIKTLERTMDDVLPKNATVFKFKNLGEWIWMLYIYTTHIYYIVYILYPTFALQRDLSSSAKLPENPHQRYAHRLSVDIPFPIRFPEGQLAGNSILHPLLQ